MIKLKKLTTITAALGCAALAPVSAQDAEKGKLEIPPVMLIQNVHVWDGTSDTLKKDTDVLIVGDKIKKVAKDIPTQGTVEVDAVRKEIQKQLDARG